MPKVLDVFELERSGEAEQLQASEYGKKGNKKLLWHGTDVAVAAAISSSGLRIMPHSGGRVGKGIYLASECGKSGFVSTSHPTCMASMHGIHRSHDQ